MTLPSISLQTPSPGRCHLRADRGLFPEELRQTLDEGLEKNKKIIKKKKIAQRIKRGRKAERGLTNKDLTGFLAQMGESTANGDQSREGFKQKLLGILSLDGGFESRQYRSRNLETEKVGITSRFHSRMVSKKKKKKKKEEQRKPFWKGIFFHDACCHPDGKHLPLERPLAQQLGQEVKTNIWFVRQKMSDHKTSWDKEK